MAPSPAQEAFLTIRGITVFRGQTNRKTTFHIPHPINRNVSNQIFRIRIGRNLLLGFPREPRNLIKSSRQRSVPETEILRRDYE